MSSEGSQLHTRTPAQSSTVSKTNPHNYRLQKQWGLWLSEMQGFWSPSKFLLKGPHMDLLILTPSELQHWGNSLKKNRDIHRETEFSGIRTRIGGSFPHTEPAGGLYI